MTAFLEDEDRTLARSPLPGHGGPAYRHGGAALRAAGRPLTARSLILIAPGERGQDLRYDGLRTPISFYALASLARSSAVW
jgi:hypothetical protein